MGLNLREAAGRRELEEGAALRLAKLEEIQQLWEDLFVIVAGEDVFKKCPEFHD
jgi:hypothetical protein